ncbi:MAG: TIGR04442 family protein [bacterium]|nr:MAG: TIGR04442 family protein [bacterium]
MIKDLRIHGVTGPDKEFFATFCSRGLGNWYFHEVAEVDGLAEHRFFSGGSEFVVRPDAISHRGNGGSFCPYMFGVDEPIEDLVKTDVINRLVVFGAVQDETARVRVTDGTAGVQTFKEIFLRGHAVFNYFFFVHFSDKYPLKQQQQRILKVLGRSLKRHPLDLKQDDSAIIEGLREHWENLGPAFFLLKVISRPNMEFYQSFEEAYSRSRTLEENEQQALSDLGRHLGVDPYSQERIKIDVMYRHMENRQVVEEYRSVLVDVWRRDEILFDDSARISRLRTVALRKGIPANLLDALDEKLLVGKKVIKTQEPSYLVEARGVLETIFLRSRRVGVHLETEDLIRLLRTKLMALENRDSAFDRILIEVGKDCDELSKDADDPSILEEFGSIVTYFDRFDAVYHMVNRLAFHEEEKLPEERLRSLLANKRIFDGIQDGLFEELFIRPVLNNAYLPNFGRRKISTLTNGLNNIVTGDLSLQDLVISMENLVREEREYHIVKTAMDRWLRKFGRSLRGAEEEQIFINDVKKMLTSRDLVRAGSPDAFFRKALDDLKMERLYVSNVLPRAIRSKDSAIRDEFIRTSGLEMLRIEELEREFQVQHRVEDGVLEQIRGR